MSFLEKLKEGYHAAAQDDAELSTTARFVMFMGLLALIGIVVVIAL